jgi:hypothetical protein
MQYLSGGERVKRVNEKAGDLVQADIYGSSELTARRSSPRRSRSTTSSPPRSKAARS